MEPYNTLNCTSFVCIHEANSTCKIGMEPCTKEQCVGFYKRCGNCTTSTCQYNASYKAPVQHAFDGKRFMRSKTVAKRVSFIPGTNVSNKLTDLVTRSINLLNQLNVLFRHC